MVFGQRKNGPILLNYENPGAIKVVGRIAVVALRMRINAGRLSN